MNGLYSNLQQKKIYYNTSNNYINGFWISLLGILGLRIIKPKNPILTQLLNYNYMIMLYSQDAFANDNLPDYIISIKVLRELGILNASQTQQLFKFLDKCRTSGFKTIDQTELRRVLKLLPIYKIRPTGFISDDVYDFMAGKIDLEFITNRLYLYNEQTKISAMLSEFGNMFKTDLIKYGKK